MEESKLPNRQLPEAIESAELLVNYACRNAVDIPDDLLRVVAFARRGLAEGVMSADEEANFFRSYFELSKRVAPVTVGSLRDSYQEFGSIRKPWWNPFGNPVRRSNADVTVSMFRVLAFSFLFLLVLFQGYAFVGSWLVTNTDPQHFSVSSSNDTTATQIYLGEISGDVSRDGVADTLNEQAVDTASAHLLSLWVGPFNYFVPQSSFPQIETQTRRNFAQLLLIILQSYLLPLLYGGLGATTYVVRELIEDTRNRTFRVESQSAYGLRIVLGIVAGLAIGWFSVASQNASKISGFEITPAALSFIAGYSVEVLFSVMDKVNTAFGSLSKDRKS